MRKVTLRQRLRYAFDNTMSRGAVSLVGWLAVATLLLIVLFSVIVLAAGIAPANAGGHKHRSVPAALQQLRPRARLRRDRRRQRPLVRSSS